MKQSCTTGSFGKSCETGNVIVDSGHDVQRCGDTVVNPQKKQQVSVVSPLLLLLSSMGRCSDIVVNVGNHVLHKKNQFLQCSPLF